MDSITEEKQENKMNQVDENQNTGIPSAETKPTPELSVAPSCAAFRTACRIHLSWTIGRYLMSHAEGRRDGWEKAVRHIELCEFYVAAIRGHHDPSTVRRLYEDDFDALHDESKELTDNLDTAIGFPIHGMPEYDELEPKFFERFHEIAMSTLAPRPVTSEQKG